MPVHAASSGLEAEPPPASGAEAVTNRPRAGVMARARRRELPQRSAFGARKSVRAAVVIQHGQPGHLAGGILFDAEAEDVHAVIEHEGVRGHRNHPDLHPGLLPLVLFLARSRSRAPKASSTRRW
jgi:hypothetical protein